MARLVMILAALCVVALAAPAGATPDDPEFSDECGGGEGAPHQLTAPTNDICTGWFTSSVVDEDTPVLSLAVALAPVAVDRPNAFYQASWRTADCYIRLQHRDGLGRYEAGEVVVDDVTTDTLFAGCGALQPRPCETNEVGTACSSYESEKTYPLPDGAFTADGDTVSWTITFAGAFAELAPQFAPGTSLRNPYLVAGNSEVYGSGYCVGDECGSILSDTASGRDHVMGG